MPQDKLGLRLIIFEDTTLPVAYIPRPPGGVIRYETSTGVVSLTSNRFNGHQTTSFNVYMKFSFSGWNHHVRFCVLGIIYGVIGLQINTGPTVIFPFVELYKAQITDVDISIVLRSDDLVLGNTFIPPKPEFLARLWFRGRWTGTWLRRRWGGGGTTIYLFGVLELAPKGDPEGTRNRGASVPLVEYPELIFGRIVPFKPVDLTGVPSSISPFDNSEFVDR